MIFSEICTQMCISIMYEERKHYTENRNYYLDLLNKLECQHNMLTTRSLAKRKFYNTDFSDDIVKIEKEMNKIKYNLLLF